MRVKNKRKYGVGEVIEETQGSDEGLVACPCDKLSAAAGAPGAWRGRHDSRGMTATSARIARAPCRRARGIEVT